MVEIESNYYDSLLEDPVEEKEVIEDEDNENFWDSEEEETEEKTEEEHNEEQPEEKHEDAAEEDVLTSYLKSYGIQDPSKIQFENEEGGVDEVDWNTLSKEDQLNMLKELSSSDYTDYERQVIDFIRQNGGDLRNIVAQYQQAAIEDYLSKNPEAKPQRSYKIDDYSDDELYISDLAAKFPDFTDEELTAKLETAKLNEELFKKEVDSLRQFYKSEEEKLEEQAKETEKQQYDNLMRTLHDSASKFDEIVLDADDPKSDALVLEDQDRQVMMDYLLAQDKDGRSQFDKDLSDPDALIEIAWLRTHARDTLTGVSQYWKKELADTRKELAKVRKELEKYTNNGTNVVVEKPKSKQKKEVKSAMDLWV